MKPLPFMVSIQWGSGHHYFLHGYNSREEACRAAEAHLKHLVQRERQRTRKNTLKPTVYVFELRETFQELQ